MNASCAASGPEKDRWALREMIDSLPFQEFRGFVMGASAASGIGLSSKQRSPKNWSGSRIAITASLPCSDTTVSFTLPFGGPKRKFLIELLHGERIAPKHAPHVCKTASSYSLPMRTDGSSPISRFSVTL
jgi:hypothetical protein